MRDETIPSVLPPAGTTTPILSPETKTPAWRRYLVAVVLTLLAVWVRMTLAPAESGGRFVTAGLAVALATLYGGPGPGLVSTFLGMVLVNFFMVEPYFSPAIDDPVAAFWLNSWHLLNQLVVVGAIWLMQSRHQGLVRAHRIAQENQRHFLETFEHAASGISHVSVDGQLLRTNHTFCEMVGYSKEDLERMHFRDITHPEDVTPDLSMLTETLTGKRNSYTLQKRYIHREGHIVWAQLTVSLVRNEQGQPDYFISVVQDISNQKATEAALQTSQSLLDQAQKLAQIGVWQADLQQGRISSLPGSKSFLHFPRFDYDIEEVLHSIHPDDQSRVKEHLHRALKGVAPYEIEYRVILQGREYWHAVKAEFERDPQGRVLRALGVTQDITQRKHIELEIQRLNTSLEERIQQRTRALKEAYDDLEMYSYAVAHDLRSPLRIINGFAQALQEDHPELEQASHNHLSRIKAASRKMGELIDGLLTLSQYARGEVRHDLVDLSAVATRQLEELATAEPERQVTWVVEPAVRAHADPALMEALLQNLLHNAWKYTAKAEHAHIRFFTRQIHGERHFCVSDNGAGFDMGQAHKLFLPFQRLHQPHEFGGLGIGLATARRIVLRHGGCLHADSAPGQGATFCFTLAPESRKDDPRSGDATQPSGIEHRD